MLYRISRRMKVTGACKNKGVVIKMIPPMMWRNPSIFSELKYRSAIIPTIKGATIAPMALPVKGQWRSEERRVGKECRCGWARGHCKEKRVKGDTQGSR